MRNETVTEIANRIEAAFRELSKVTGATHISGYLIDGIFSIDDYTDLKNPKFKIYRMEM